MLSSSRVPAGYDTLLGSIRFHLGAVKVQFFAPHQPGIDAQLNDAFKKALKRPLTHSEYEFCSSCCGQAQTHPGHSRCTSDDQGACSLCPSTAARSECLR